MPAGPAGKRRPAGTEQLPGSSAPTIPELLWYLQKNFTGLVRTVTPTVMDAPGSVARSIPCSGIETRTRNPARFPTLPRTCRRSHSNGSRILESQRSVPGFVGMRKRNRVESVPHANTGAVVVIDDAGFLDATVGGYTVVDFWAPWCGPCKQLAPVFETIAARYGDRLKFARCDVEENPVTASMVGIMSIPTIVVFDPEGNEYSRMTGAPPPAQLETAIIELAESATRHTNERAG